MFFLINREKLNAYLVSVITVLVLFAMASTINPNKNTVETSANLENENQIDITNKKEERNNYIPNRLEQIIE